MKLLSPPKITTSFQLYLEDILNGFDYAEWDSRLPTSLHRIKAIQLADPHEEICHVEYVDSLKVFRVYSLHTWLESERHRKQMVARSEKERAERHARDEEFKHKEQEMKLNRVRLVGILEDRIYQSLDGYLPRELCRKQAEVLYDKRMVKLCKEQFNVDLP